MITVPAHRVKQFGVEFFQASFSAKDIDRLVKFEVLGYAGAQPPAGAKQTATRARVNWEMLEKRIAESESRISAPSSDARSTSWSRTIAIARMRARSPPFPAP